MAFDIHSGLDASAPTDWIGVSFDTLAEAIQFASQFAAEARHDEYPLEIIAVIDSNDNEIVYKTSATD